MKSPRKVMSTHFDSAIRDLSNIVSKDSDHNINHNHRNVLRSKENTYKYKCRQNLKRKLKKYRLRQDGKEDQDILDVSESLLTSLFIRSPNKAKDNIELETEQYRKNNYLFRMVKRKQSTFKTTNTPKSKDEVMITVEDVSPTSDNNKMNAFKLLMDSRSKSIGTNSPGKEPPNNELDTQELIEKKNMKVKRTLLLQKMAEQRGALKKKDLEEQHEECIKKKMEKRAEKLKSMILNKEPKSSSEAKVIHENRIITKHEESGPHDNIATKKETVLEKNMCTLELVDIFSESTKICPVKKLITKEDEEFLKKLSPSIRKTESMLSYFKKIEKEPEAHEENNENNIIKVKLGSKNKKRQKKKLSLAKNVTECESLTTNMDNNVGIDEEILIVVEVKEDKEITENSNLPELVPEITNVSDNLSNLNKTEIVKNERRKRKRDTIEKTLATETPIPDQNHEEKRPRRTVKKPLKYYDDAEITSSDEELHIFTPKKENNDKQKRATKLNDDIIMINDENNIIKSSGENKNKKSNKDAPSKPVKLAPIFAKPQLNPAALEAKQKFLQSGVPEQLKKIMSKQKVANTEVNDYPVVVHVQQLKTPDQSLTHNQKLADQNDGDDFSLEDSKDSFSKLLNLSSVNKEVSVQPKYIVGVQEILQSMKETYPKFPIYRTYKQLREKKKGEFKYQNMFVNLDNSAEILNCSIDTQSVDNPDQLSWCDKYKPLSGNEIIGNFESVNDLKKWLVTWTESDTNNKRNRNDSDSSDYFQSEADSRDSMKSNNNLLILSGPTGCGKTSAVYAVAAELSIKVIEVNASSKRTGKIMLQDLQEATQSHKVNRSTGSSENSQKSQETANISEGVVKKRGRPKKSEQGISKKHGNHKLKDLSRSEINGIPSSQEITRTAMSLILIDDADIVFDQDDGFCSAISQLVQSSKRPVILVTGSLTVPHLQKFLQYSKILKMKPLLPNMLGTWLDLMCLADTGICWPGLGANFLNFFNGDMRRTINYLQFHIGSQETSIDSQITQNSQRVNIDDENSGMSWADRDTMEDKNLNECDDKSQALWNSISSEFLNINDVKYSLKLFDVWYNVPKLLATNRTETENVCSKLQSLESISKVLDTISECDYFSHNMFDTEVNLSSRPWYSSELSSVSESQNYEYYDRKFATDHELCRTLISSSIIGAQENIGSERKYNLEMPGIKAKRQRDRIVSRHNDLTSYLSQSSLDRRALALDYWASCRDICRIEKSKTDSNFKRNNRFCHYLKSLNVLCTSNTFDNLANSLASSI